MVETTMKTIIITFISAFLQVFFIAIQTKNIAYSNHVMAFLTSIGIGCAWMYNANSVVKNGRAEKIAYVCGSSTGVVSAIILYDALGGTNAHQ